MNLKKYAAPVLRLGLAIVFLWFGFTQLFDQSAWLSLIPTGLITITGISAKAFVIFNGIFEVFMASLLILGIRIRIVSALLLLHLIIIIIDIGINPVGLRDIGLAFALLSIFLQGDDIYC